MKLYRNLSKIKFLKKSYAFKFLFVAFIGIHIPLIGMLFFVLYGSENISTQTILFFALIMTLLATAATLYFLKQLIKPIETASKALDNYRNERKVPAMPAQFQDEAGLLMSNIQKSILENEQFISDKQDLIYLLSHDFKNFTGNSQGLAQLILAENATEIVQEYAQLILESTNQQFTFIEIFIKLIRDEEEISNRSLRTNIIYLPAVFDLVKNQLNQKLVSKNIKLISTIISDEVTLYIDQDLLVRVLINLVDNAIKFSFPESEIQLKFSNENEKFIFSVSDSGIGFNPRNKEELYKKFTSRSRVGTANEPSTGIGLYLCKKIVEKYKGNLSLESEGINQGAKFSITFTSAL
ncbi:Signal transduction histidine kinase [Flavobacterium segetis]|uniref:histidine kinase n=1 Tax=Flavobacterium segetis TaxID=271157 RepID=A0A1M5JX23_9FLAO|nr:HAMP domain-containing sensor histidine kinase [Flavobacterium segetis]SHG44925.1 Signal transduction histidine kinase [Flavobacterium segetis]